MLVFGLNTASYWLNLGTLWLSWLFHRYALMSDPASMVDAQVALLDGRVVWAKEETRFTLGLTGRRGRF